MENDIESSPPPPVSSLRSRFEALSRGTNSPDGSETSKPSKGAPNSKTLFQPPRGPSRPSTPSLVLSSSKPSEPATTNGLRRVVSNPTSQPTTPNPSSRPNSGYGDSLIAIAVNGDEEGGSNPITPRKTPSTPNLAAAGKAFPTGLGLGLPIDHQAAKATIPRNASGSSIESHEKRASDMEKASTDVAHPSKKLTKKPPPPPPPPGRKPPLPRPRSTAADSRPPSCAETPILGLEGSSRRTAEPNHLAPPPLPTRGAPNPNPNLPPRPASMVSITHPQTLTPQPAGSLPPNTPPLPPRSADNLNVHFTTATLIQHTLERGFKTSSTEQLSFSGSDGSEYSKPLLIPPKLPFRGGTNSVPHSPHPSISGPPLPPRAPTSVDDAPAGAESLAPPLPPRGLGASASASTEDTSSRSTLGIRRMPPPPNQGSRSNSPNTSRESLVHTSAAETASVSSSTSLAPPSHPSSYHRSALTDPVSSPPPPTRTNPDLGGKERHHGHGHHHHHFPHLPHQLNSLPITKILAAVKFGGSSNGGSRSPQGYAAGSPEAGSMGGELNGGLGLPPPPVRSIGDKVPALRPGSSLGRRRRSGSSSSDEDDGNEDEDEDDEVSGLVASGTGTAGGGGQKRPMSKVGEELPDSSKSNRRPPILEEFLHPPPGFRSHHGTKGLHVPAHTGVVAVAGWWVVIASHGMLTIVNMDPEERRNIRRSMDSGEYDRATEREIDLALGRKGGGPGNGVWTIELKDLPIDWKADKPRVTAMEFRHGTTTTTTTSNPSSTDASRTSFNTNLTRVDDKTDLGRYLWCGTKDGYLFELDVFNGGRLMDVRVGAHTGHVTTIARLGRNRMLTIDENGKSLVFSGVGVSPSGRESDGKWLSRSNPRVQRVIHREGFARVMNGRLWTSPAPGTSGSTSTSSSNNVGAGDSKTSLGSIASLASSSQRKQHHRNASHTQHHLGPNVRVHDIDEDGGLVARSVVPGHQVGAVTCGTTLPSTPGLVYLGHEGGWVTVWGEAAGEKGCLPLQRQQSVCSTATASSSESETEDESLIDDRAKVESPANTGTNNSLSHGFLPPPSRLGKVVVPTTDAEGGPVCLAKVKISISDVISLEGVGSRLWAGNRKGFILAYDVTGGTEAGDVGAVASLDKDAKPWIVTNIWKAHGDFPVLKVVVDPYSIAKTQQLVVYSIGRDEVLRFWDGLLSQNWIDSEMLLREPSFCTFRPLNVLICTWNIDAAKPDSLVGTNNVTAFQRFLSNSALDNSPPDMIVFGFQEVIDLEDKKLTAKTVLLGSSKRTDGTISEKVSSRYRLWHDRLVGEVRKAYPHDPYVVQHTENLVGLFTCIFVRRSLAYPSPSSPTNVRDVGITTIKCGMHGMYGNKGAIVARFTVDDTSFCFLNCHLAAGQAQKVNRNMDLASILEDKAVFPPSADMENSLEVNPDFVAYVGGGDGSMILDHEICFLNGDLNYRIDQRREAVINHIQAGNYTHLLQYDQLLHEMSTNPSFRLHTFIEPPIKFAPTYKYDRNTNIYDTSEKKRIPAWCDRILYRSKDAKRIECLWYGRFEKEPDVSDHRPVGGAYRVIIKKVIPEKRVKELAAVKKMWEQERKRVAEEARTFYEEYY